MAAIAGLVVACLAAPAAAGAAGRANTAALQVALRAGGAYSGVVDGIAGPGTMAALRSLQRRFGLAADGIAGPRTRRALGPRGRHRYGSRQLRTGHVGWDVAALQFKLASHGFASGAFDGALGARVVAALARFQSWAGLRADGVAGPLTLRALRAAPPRSPVRLLWPVRVPLGSAYGPRGARFHAGIDLPAPTGVPVTAAGFGTVAFAGFSPSGWGNLVTVRHRFGLHSLYAHLSAIDVRPGQFVGAGQRIGAVGASGHAEGPHLHFEVLLRGANVDPLSALG